MVLGQLDSHMKGDGVRPRLHITHKTKTIKTQGERAKCGTEILKPLEENTSANPCGFRWWFPGHNSQSTSNKNICSLGHH